MKVLIVAIAQLDRSVVRSAAPLVRESAELLEVSTVCSGSTIAAAIVIGTTGTSAIVK